MSRTAKNLEKKADMSEETAPYSAIQMKTLQGSSAKDGKTGIVRPVMNAIRILRFLGETKKPTRSIEIARTLKINPSTCFNIVRTLTAEGILNFNSQSKTYSLGLGFVRLANSALTETDKVSLIRPHMQEIVEASRVTVALWRRQGLDHFVLVSIELNRDDLHISMTPGHQLPLLMGSAGRIFAAHSNFTKAELRKLFKTLRWRKPLSFETYWKEVREYSERGWAIDEGYFASGVTSIAVPIYDTAGSLLYVLSAVMFSGQYDEKGLASVVATMKHHSAEIAKVLI